MKATSPTIAQAIMIRRVCEGAPEIDIPIYIAVNARNIISAIMTTWALLFKNNNYLLIIVVRINILLCLLPKIIIQ